jgi:hypothetical protein
MHVSVKSMYMYVFMYLCINVCPSTDSNLSKFVLESKTNLSSQIFAQIFACNAAFLCLVPCLRHMNVCVCMCVLHVCMHL